MRVFFLFIIYGALIIAVKSVWHLAGDFLLVAVIYFGFYEEWFKGLVLSVFLGFLLDVSSIIPLGTACFSFAAVFGLVRFFRKKILIQTPLSRFCWVGLLSLMHGLISFLFLTVVGDVARTFSLFFPRMLLSSILDGLLGTFWFSCLRWYQDLTWNKLVRSHDILLKK